MENSSPLVLEISSDEEADFGDTRKGGGYGVGGGEFCDREDYDWLSKLLGEVGDGKDDDSDDVVLVSEVLPKPSKKPRLELLAETFLTHAIFVLNFSLHLLRMSSTVASVTVMFVTHWLHVPIGAPALPVLIIVMLLIRRNTGKQSETSIYPNNPSSIAAPPQPNSCPVTAHLPFISSNVNVPNAVNQGRVHPSGCAVPIYRPRSQLVPFQSRRPCNNNVASRNKSHNAGSQLRVVFKRSGLVGASPNNSHAYGSQLSRDPLKRCRAFQTPVINGHIGSNQRNIGSRLVFLFNRRANLRCRNAFGSELHSRFMISSNQNAGNNLENQSSQPQAHNNPSSLLFGIQNDFQGNHTQTGINESPDDFDLVWDSSLSHGNLQMHGEVSQCPSTAPADNSQIHDITKNDHHQSIEPVDSFHQHSVVPEDNSSLTNDADCKFPESVPPDTLDFQFDSWMFENQSLPGALEVPVSPLWNAFSPEPASIDTESLSGTLEIPVSHGLNF
ncbi:hypothetical protein DH2020_001210 [Rehmannia glutinosa]|uniref:Uncharacterized protein n=1 Tax=Rehmannia glutinosa TaxID=99300 RepID=A0ABR0XYQ4_REHGL